MPRIHHARVFTKCTEHDNHATHLISTDDEAWLIAKLVRRFLTVNNINCEVDLWTEGERGGFKHEDGGALTDHDWDTLPF